MTEVPLLNLNESAESFINGNSQNVKNDNQTKKKEEEKQKEKDHQTCNNGSR